MAKRKTTLVGHCCDKCGKEESVELKGFDRFEILLRGVNTIGETEDMVLMLTPEAMNRLLVLLE